MHTRMYRGYMFAWGDPKNPLQVTIMGTVDDDDYLTIADDDDAAERIIDDWLDAR